MPQYCANNTVLLTKEYGRVRQQEFIPVRQAGIFIQALLIPFQPLPEIEIFPYCCYVMGDLVKVLISQDCRGQSDKSSYEGVRLTKSNLFQTYNSILWNKFQDITFEDGRVLERRLI